ncbi:hypothetical protein GQ54DRAFT_312198 [Martensiomyces pterosporus]|nr:hypothetical protein GQ54DRAFT_312198 [Martensiomyces pterosporus]
MVGNGANYSLMLNSLCVGVDSSENARELIPEIVRKDIRGDAKRVATVDIKISFRKRTVGIKQWAEGAAGPLNGDANKLQGAIGSNRELEIVEITSDHRDLVRSDATDWFAAAAAARRASTRRPSLRRPSSRAPTVG